MGGGKNHSVVLQLLMFQMISIVRRVALRSWEGWGGEGVEGGNRELLFNGYRVRSA